MKVMILAAGAGKRMRPLTEGTSKALLEVGNKSLIEHQVLRLVAAGFSDLVINVHHFPQQIFDALQDGSRFGARIAYSIEDELLETAGGIKRALPLLGSNPFLVVNADVFTEYPYEQLRNLNLQSNLGHLVMVENPAEHPQGDFGWSNETDRESPLVTNAQRCYTFAGISVLAPAFIKNQPDGPLPLRPLLDQAIAERRLTGEIYQGYWTDVGTPERLNEVRTRWAFLHSKC